MGPTTQSIERLFKSIVAIKSAEDEKKEYIRAFGYSGLRQMFLDGVKRQIFKRPYGRCYDDHLYE